MRTLLHAARRDRDCQIHVPNRPRLRRGKADSIHTHLRGQQCTNSPDSRMTTYRTRICGSRAFTLARSIFSSCSFISKPNAVNQTFLDATAARNSSAFILLEALPLPVTFTKQVRTKQSFCTHDIQNKDGVAFDSIENTTRRDDDFPVR